MLYAVKDKKWDKLELLLKDFVKSQMNEYGQLTKPMREIFRDFASKYDTTESSTSYYYYSRVKDMIDNEDSVEEIKNEVEHVNGEAVDESESVKDEVASLIDHIEDETEYRVSEKSEKLIAEMVDEIGAIETLVSIFKVIRDIDSVDMLFAIICEAKNRRENPLN